MYFFKDYFFSDFDPTSDLAFAGYIDKRYCFFFLPVSDMLVWCENIKIHPEETCIQVVEKLHETERTETDKNMNSSHSEVGSG